MQTVYVLQSEKDGNLYIGCASHLIERMKMHQAGRVRSTKNRLHVKLIYHEMFVNVYEAFRKERFYKTAKGKRELKKKLHWGVV